MNQNEFASLEWSKKLAPLFPDAEWYWINYGTDSFTKIEHKDNLSKYTKLNYSYPALSVMMLLEKLPYLIERNLDNGQYREYIFSVHKRKNDWLVGYGLLGEMTDKSLPNALAKMTYFLLKKGLLNGPIC